MSNSGSFLSILGSTISYVLGFLTAMFAEPARQRFFRPILKLNFSNAEDYVARTPIAAGWHAVYIRVKVVNETRRLARQCRAYLINVEQLNSHGAFAPTIYADSIQLAWSCRERGKEREAIDLPHGVAQYIDIVATDQNNNNFKPQISPFPFRYNELFNVTPKTTYRFTIQVSGDGVDPEFIKVVFVWKGNWESFDVYHDQEQG